MNPWSRLAPKFNHFVQWPIANLPWKLHANPFGSFWAKLLTDRQRRKRILLGGGNKNDVNITSGYATMVHSRGCNPHRSTTTFANLEITSLWRHWWRHNSETIRDREERRPPRAMKSSELSNGENRIALQQLLQNRKWRHWWRHNLG